MSVPVMARSIALCSLQEIPDGSARHFRVDGRELAVFHVEGRLYALDGRCPHRGGPLGEGDLLGDEIVCPWHGWSFSVRTGASKSAPGEAATCIPVRVEGDMVIVELG